MEATHYTTYPRLSPSVLHSELASSSVLITGGGHGVGISVAKSFVQAGVSSIILVGRTESKLKSAAESLASTNGTTKITYHVADISSKTDIQHLFESLTTSPDILINNAGFMAKPANFIDADLDEYWSAFEINVYGTALVTQSYLRHRRTLLPSGSKPAVIITVNTQGAFSIRVPNLSSYAASKAALARWAELVSVDIPEDVARFISVNPGSVDTAMGEKSGLMGYFTNSEPELVGDFMVWLVSEEAKFLAGRFAWVNWDVDELVKRKEEIVEKDLLSTSLVGA